MRWAEVDEDVIPLTAADSDFHPAPEISQAMISYINGGYYCYTPKRGFPWFRKNIAKALKDRKGEIVNPDYVLPIDSAARGMQAVASAVLQPGDEAIVFDPRGLPVQDLHGGRRSKDHSLSHAPAGGRYH